MKHIKRPFLVLSVVALLLGPCLAAWAAGPVPKAGQVELLGAINAARGKVVVVNFFASWCGPCKQEIPHLKELRSRFGEDKLFMMGVSLDFDPSAYQELVDRTGFPYPVHLAREDVPAMFRVQTIPKTLFYDRRGKLAREREGLLEMDELEGLVKELLGG